MVEIPVDRLFNPGRERFAWRPAEFALQLRAVDRVPSVVSGPVGHVSDLARVRRAVGARRLSIEQGANLPDDLEVRLFVQPTNVVGFTYATALQHEPDRRGVILNIEPVADLPAIAVDGKRFALKGVEDHQWDQLLGEMIGTVVVRAVGGQRQEFVRVMISADQVIAGCLRRGVRRVRSEWRFLCERGIFGPQRPVHFIGRDMEEPEPGFLQIRELRPVQPGRVEQPQGADDVRLDERFRRIDRAIDVRLRRKVHDRVDLVVGKNAADEIAVPDATVDEDVARVTHELRQVGRIAGVREGVEINEPGEGRALLEQPLPDKVGADEPTAAGDKDIHKKAIRALKLKTRRTQRSGGGALPIVESSFDGLTNGSHSDSDGLQFARIHHAIRTRGLGGALHEVVLALKKREVLAAHPALLNQVDDLAGRHCSRVGDIVGAERDALLPAGEGRSDKLLQLRNGVRGLEQRGVPDQLGQVVARVVDLVERDAQPPDVDIRNARQHLLAERLGAAVKRAVVGPEAEVRGVVFAEPGAVGPGPRVDTPGRDVAPGHARLGAGLSDDAREHRITEKAFPLMQFTRVDVGLARVAGGID